MGRESDSEIVTGGLELDEMGLEVYWFHDLRVVERHRVLTPEARTTRLITQRDTPRRSTL